ncbi:MAG: LuxR C-terminal-related transcriptional regulator [Nannocystaceae bacterium]|nr:response regulator transcription factor [Myxococcales bacterium]
MTDTMEPQLQTPPPSAGWTPSSLTARPAPRPEKPRRPNITPALADLVHGYRKPAFMTDDRGQVICMNAAAGRLLDTRADADSAQAGLVSLEQFDRKATLQADGKTLFLVIPDTPGDAEARINAAQLPPRLAKIARLVVSGCTDKQIASRTGLSFSTVRTYVRQIYRRMGVHSRVELVHATNQGQTLAVD